MKRLILTSALLLAPSLALAQGLTVPVPNAGTTGTTLNSLAKLTGAPSTAVKTATTDTSGAEGVVINGAGTTGNALILKAGQSTCNFDAATTAGDWVQISSTVAGDCHDAGSTYPTSGQVVGRVLSTNGASGAFSMNIIANALPASGGGGGGALAATTIATNTTAACGNAYFATAALTLTLPAANSQTSSCQISVKNATANTATTVVTLAVNAADNLNGGTTGAGTSLYAQQSAWYGTTAADHSWRDLGTQAACIAYTSSATVQITATRALYIAMMGQGGAGGNGFAQTTASTIGSGGGGGGSGQYLTQWFVGPDLAQLGASVSLTFPAAATHGNTGGTLTFGSFLTAYGGNNGSDGVSGSTGSGGASASVNGIGSGGGFSSPNGAATGYWGLGTGGEGSSGVGSNGTPSNSNIGPYAAGGGSAGGGISATDVQSAGGAGRNQQFANGGTAGLIGGGAGGDAAGWNTLPYLPGAPGGAGGSNNTGTGGSAGHSGWGAGGSAGGACWNGGSACTAGLGAAGGLPFTELCQW